MLQYTLILLSSYFGILAGVVISAMAKEELKTGKIYFKLLKIVTASMIFGVFSYEYVSIYFTIGLVLISGVVLFFLEKLKFVNIIFYGVFAILFALSKNSDRAIMGILIFFFGVVAVSAQYNKKLSLWKNLSLAIKQSFIFLILGIALYFV